MSLPAAPLRSRSGFLCDGDDGERGEEKVDLNELANSFLEVCATGARGKPPFQVGGGAKTLPVWLALESVCVVWKTGCVQSALPPGVVNGRGADVIAKSLRGVEPKGLKEAPKVERIDCIAPTLRRQLLKLWRGGHPEKSLYTRMHA